MKKLLFIILFCYFEQINAQIISTVAGNGIPGYSGDGGPATLAQLFDPLGVTFDASGNMYIAEAANNNRIRKVSNAGIITTVAGIGTAGFSGDGGLATAAELNAPFGITVDAGGNLYIPDFSNRRIRKVNTSGIITTIAGNGTAGFSGDGGLATSAQLNGPAAIAIDGAGNMYIADYNNNRIRMVNTSGIITTVVGNGTVGFSGDGGQATLAQLNNPSGIVFDAAGNLYIADCNNNRIRKVNTSGIINTIAGNGTGGFSGDGGLATVAELRGPDGIVIDAAGNLYIADDSNHRIRKVNTSGIITTIAGNGTTGFSGDGGPATAAGMGNPNGICLDTAGNLYITDSDNNRIRKVIGVAVGVEKFEENNTLQKLKIYPNPATNSISFNVKNISNYQNSTITIQNVLGEEIKKLSFTKNIDVSDLAEGCYFLQITLSNRETYKAKFIKQ